MNKDISGMQGYLDMEAGFGGINVHSAVDNIYGYTDIHTHILPGIDDGAASIDEAVMMAKTAYREGILNIIATPHYKRHDSYQSYKQTIEVFHNTRDAILSVHSDMKLFIGHEIYASAGIVSDLKWGKALTLAGTDYVLIEFDTLEEYVNMYYILRTLVAEGYRPILAHAERYRCLLNNIKRVHNLTDMGVYIQVNARNFLHRYFDIRTLRNEYSGRRAAWCRKLLKKNLIHFVASDCHDCGKRKPLMKAAVDKMQKIADITSIDKITKDNIVKLLNNECL